MFDDVAESLPGPAGAPGHVDDAADRLLAPPDRTARETAPAPAAVAGPGVGGPAGGPVRAATRPRWSSRELTGLAQDLAGLGLEVTDAERVEQLTALEHLKAACAAAQARITGRFTDSQEQLARDWHERARACAAADDFEGWRAARQQARTHELPDHTVVDPRVPDPAGGRTRRRWRQTGSTGTGVAAQVALARHESPAKGVRLVATALALTTRLPHTLTALSRGWLNEYRAGLVATLTSHLSDELARRLDTEVIGTAGPAAAGWGDSELQRRVRACADRLDPAGATARARTAESERRVTLRPVPDTMALLSAILPVAQAVAVHAALTRAAATAKAAGDPRSKDQIMADTLVALVTGQQAATDIPIEIQLIITDRALFDGDDTPAHIPGYGPVPARWARHLLTPDQGEQDEQDDDPGRPDEPGPDAGQGDEYRPPDHEVPEYGVPADGVPAD
ncbi:DUF222 domain-containing protein, partial [Intrasporangium sp.]|uniref:DUF222 domain-containing protein n=1 Tax=Intrasporangium sp. TaxID=1925024 RepID=UPI003221D638